NALLDLISTQMSGLTERGFGDEPTAFIALLRAKEMSGLERSMGATGFTAGRFDPAVYRQFLQFRGAQGEALGPNLRRMPAALAARAESLLGGDAAGPVIAFRAAADRAAAGAGLPQGQGPAWFDAASARINGLSEIEAGIGDVLTRRAAEMKQSATRRLIATALAALACAVGVAAFAYVSARAMVRVVARLSQSLRRIGARDYDFNVAGVKRRDELGDMARSLLEVREQLKAGEAANREATYKGSGFNGSSVAMMIVDRDLIITYANEATQRFFAQHKDVFRAAFPTFDPDALVGANIDMFGATLGVQQKLRTEQDQLPFKTNIVVGDVRIAVNVSAVYDADGAYVGATLEWADVTQASLNAGVLRAIDNTQATAEFNLDGVFLNANENFLRASGLTLNDVRGRPHAIICSPEVANAAEETDLWRRLAGGEAVIARVERRTKAGAPLWLDAAYNPVVDGAGKPFKVALIATDVTAAEERRREEENYRAEQEEAGKERAAALAVVVDNLADGLSRIAEGDFSKSIDAAFAEEYAALKADFNAAVEKLAQAEADKKLSVEAQNFVVRELERVLTKLSDGDLSVRMNDPFSSGYEAMRKNFNEALENLMSAMLTVDATGTDIKDSAGEVAQAADELAKRTDRQAATLEQTTAAVTEISATVTQSARGAQDVNDIVGETKCEAQRSGEVVRNAVDAMGRIEKSSDEISKIIGVIDDIAFQTNLLALNAGVEAARAGEAGRGFAVVAQEVRGLAQRCTDAAKEVKELISTSSEMVTDGVALVNSTGDALGGIVERIGRISDLAERIATSSNEQSIALEEVANAVTELDQVTQQNAAMVEETTAASHLMRDNAGKLATLMGRFTMAAAAGDAFADKDDEAAFAA
ncbi:MAG: methyl-accepting chemotaxis protein, partial [Pseudomonadota bacterium]